ncbi:MAG TPA: nucleotide disphospho-sugar-binding domain-containing protein [Blastocatellia bacterium]|nr:nucleotide disphospho-sugar-binding domain-containing protein [Blastocatellia bacterium]
MLDKAAYKTAFLLPRSKRHLAAKFGLDSIDIDYLYNQHSFRTELRAYGLFSPDVVIDDTNPVTGLTTALVKLPRVTIQRTGLFPGGAPCDPNYEFSLKFDMTQIPNMAFMGLPQPRTFSDFFSANCKIVPGIPSIEQLPPSLSYDPTYFFSGPLLLEDYMMEQVIDLPARADGAPGDEGNYAALERFFAEHAQRRRIYITLGTVARVGPQILSCMRRLIRQRTAVVTSVELEGLSAEERKYYFYAAYLPMNYVCKNVDMMIHQCGSGTYHYPIIHKLPTITIGTRTYDRDGVARRLQELGVSTHLKAPEERPDFEEAFQEAIERYYELDCALVAETRQRMDALNEEISRTRAAFNLEAVLQKAVK